MLTRQEVLRAVAKEKPYKLSDGNGLSLLVMPSGSKLWRFRYHFHNVEKMLSLGSYPEVGLDEAREKRDDARKILRGGNDPAAQRQEEKVKTATAGLFADAAAEYLSKLEAESAAEATMEKNRWLLLDLASPLGKRPLREITAAEILGVLKGIEKSGRRDTARRLRGVIGSVFRHAIANLKVENDPTFALRGSLLKPVVKHRPAITDEVQFGRLMASIEAYDGWPTLRAALQVLALTMTRPVELRLMKRNEIIWPKAVWRVPAERMKMRREFDVPLSKQALEALRGVWELSEGGELVFPSIRSKSKSLSENALNSALRRMGYTQDEMTAHGFRASASTILHERGFEHAVIEVCLAHEEDDETSRAYNRAKYWPQRVALMQSWADLLDGFKTKKAGSA